MSTLPDDLRELAAFLDTRPELADTIGSVFVYAFCDDAAQFARLTAQMGAARKGADAAHLNVDRQFGSVNLQVTISKNLTCERVQVGVQTVTKEVWPEGVEPEIVTVEEPKYDWVCPPSFLALGDR